MFKQEESLTALGLQQTGLNSCLHGTYPQDVTLKKSQGQLKIVNFCMLTLLTLPDIEKKNSHTNRHFKLFFQKRLTSEIRQ